VIAYDPGLKASVYYDSDAAHLGGAQLVMTLDNLTSTSSLNAWQFVTS
jgi:hypothetical protein